MKTQWLAAPHRSGGLALAFAFIFLLGLLGTSPAQAACARQSWRCLDSCIFNPQNAATGSSVWCVRCRNCGSALVAGEEVATDAEAHVPGPKIKAIDMSVELVRQLAAKHPSAAMALLSFHESHRIEGVNLYRGEGAMPGIPSARTVELMLSGAGENTILQSMEPLASDQALRVQWEAVEPEPNRLVVTFTSALVKNVEGELVPIRAISPRTVVIVSKAPARVESVSHQ